ncbi:MULTISPECIES: PhzF family phenazine biosynthesis protein [Tatumella]|uniref:PhzF family phenazine biosynthesis protein n=1 Tax=Tatumella punctata TaxID=399969 RepID=A0ABW1VLK4_9GAMM|nr:PhzF family phenazine biosynthesis protein [Tatumella sp. JGM130]MBS0894492.1 PhzF family phenazine biosynthesis protein [Tatumella sp. JGM130]
MSREVSFSQADVFSVLPFQGNPLAVICNAVDLEEQHLLQIARWMNISETTFVLPAQHKDADYRVRIFTPDGELDFAGHPTLGTAHVLLENGSICAKQGRVIQECAAGLIPVRLDQKNHLSFLAPPAPITQVSSQLIEEITGISTDDSMPPAVAGAGSRWLLLPLAHTEHLRTLTVSAKSLALLAQHTGSKGIVLFAPVSDNSGDDYELRVIFTKHGAVTEDPVTGSANAGLAQYLASQGRTDSYRARQGLSIGHHGRIVIDYAGEEVWIGGQVTTRIRGNFLLP